MLGLDHRRLFHTAVYSQRRLYVPDVYLRAPKQFANTHDHGDACLIFMKGRQNSVHGTTLHISAISTQLQLSNIDSDISIRKCTFRGPNENEIS